MRKLILVLLLAGVAAPVFAAERDGNNRAVNRERRADREQSSDDAPRRQAPLARVERSSEPRNVTPRADPPARTSFGGSDGGNINLPRTDSGERRAGDTDFEQRARKVQRPTLPDRPESERVNRGVAERDTVRDWRGAGRGQGASEGSYEDRHVRVPPNVRDGELVESRQPVPRVLRPAERRVSRTPVWGTEPPAPRTAGNGHSVRNHRWNGDWRHDRRYNWRDWRRRHHDRFRFGFYYDPFGWDYFRYGVGWRLWPSYYGSNFWLNDPWQYRLPPAYGPYRWIRYHNDALLVNIYTGQVVDVEYNFFW